MISVVIPILGILGILSVLDRYFGIAGYLFESLLNLLLYNILFAIFLIFLVICYYHIVNTQKNKMLNDIERKIDKYYKKAHITEKEKNVDVNSLMQIEQLQKIILMVKNIPSFPFTTLHKVYILSSAVIPLMVQAINYVI